MQKKSKIALIYGSRIGDGVIGMTLTHNLIRNGYQTVTFSDPLAQLAFLFPGYPIEPMSALCLQDFDAAIYPYVCPVDTPWVPQGVERIIFREHPFFNAVIPMRETFALACQKLFGIATFERFCPVHIPWEQGTHKRVAIHTTAHESFREWGQKRFDSLAQSLENLGYEPVYLVAPHEKKAWEKSPFPLVSFESLMDLAQFLAESAFFIGGDSGPGHLAALVGTRTLTLAYRKTVIKRWAPTGRIEDCVLPLSCLPSARLRRRHWQKFLSPNRVLKQFLLLANGKSA